MVAVTVFDSFCWICCTAETFFGCALFAAFFVGKVSIQFVVYAFFLFGKFIICIWQHKKQKG